ncbi:MAG: hypothetical protein IH942_08265 [Acidobacteria bacterium]|nr:hypothetical protein [Acidobacteriota bacterium]
MDGASFDEQDSIAFMARPEDLDLEDSSVVMAPDELRWTSSIDGAIGVGPAFQARLSPGLHRITVASVHGEFARVQITVLGTGSVSAAGEDADADGWPNSKDSDGQVVPTSLLEPGKFNSPHGMAVDADGNLYVAEWLIGGRLTKLAKV